MRPSSRLFGFPRPRARTLAGFVAGMLFASQVLASAGLCAVKSPVVAPIEIVIAEACEDADHQASLERAAFEPAKSTESAGGEAGPHCSSEDPSAQARTADLPGGSTQALAALPAPLGFLPFTPAARLPIADAGPPLRPLYARLNRLLL
jgi:hypothetical protein